ncbi:hypothetical protein BaRGS_00003990 [Batillaria attramentaria]|uniref:Uncharacterized protein n=1 Tax=Batillaria attramentaria TaxID=370345 RepID=A0ABD0LZK1_9CAEN
MSARSQESSTPSDTNKTGRGTHSYVVSLLGFLVCLVIMAVFTLLYCYFRCRQRQRDHSVTANSQQEAQRQTRCTAQPGRLPRAHAQPPCASHSTTIVPPATTQHCAFGCQDGRQEVTSGVSNHALNASVESPPPPYDELVADEAKNCCVTTPPSYEEAVSGGPTSLVHRASFCHGSSVDGAPGP